MRDWQCVSSTMSESSLTPETHHENETPLLVQSHEQQRHVVLPFHFPLSPRRKRMKKWEFTFLSHDRFSIIGILSGYEKGVAREERSKSAVYCIKIGLVCLIFLNKLLDYYDFLLCIYFLTTSRSIDGVYTKKKHNNEEVEARRKSRDFFSWINFLSPSRLLE